jgi:hypothetical protein
VTRAEAIASYRAEGSEPESGIIARVMFFRNGMYAVFNEWGRQMGQYHGEWLEMEPAIREEIATHPERPAIFERL